MPKITPNALVGGRSAGAEDFGAIDASPLTASLNAIAGQVLEADRIHKNAMATNAVASASQEISEFTFQLKNGYQNDDGSLSAPPPAAQHYQLYQERVKTINERNKESLGESGVYGSYEKDFRNIALKSSFDVRAHATNTMRSEANASLDKSIETFANIAAVSDDTGRGLMHSRVGDAIERNIALGAITPEQGLDRINKYEAMLTRADVISGVRADPAETALSLMKGDFPTLNPEERQRWIDTAITESDKQMREALSASDRARIDLDRANKQVQSETAKTGFELDMSGKLSVDWITGNRDKLAEDDYKYLLKQASGTSRGGAEKSDIKTYATLREAAGRGDDVRMEAKIALFGGDLSKEDYSKIVSEAEENSVSGQLPSWYKRGSEYIRDALKVSDVNPSPAQQQMLARVLDDFRDWADAHPDASQLDAQKAYRQMSIDGNLINYNELSIAIPRPTHLVGGRAKPDLAATWAKTKADFEAGKMDDFEYKRQAKIINEWRIAQERLINLGGE